MHYNIENLAEQEFYNDKFQQQSNLQNKVLHLTSKLESLYYENYSFYQLQFKYESIVANLQTLECDYDIPSLQTIIECRQESLHYKNITKSNNKKDIFIY